MIKRIFCLFLILSTLVWAGSGFSEEVAKNQAEQTRETLDSILKELESDFPNFVHNSRKGYRNFLKYERERAADKELNPGWDVVEVLKILGLGVVAAVIYGMAHDLATSKMDLAYFAGNQNHFTNVTHHGHVTKQLAPEVYYSNSPVLYSLFWGTLATFWVGLPLGGLVGIAARAGDAGKKQSALEVMKPLSIMLAASFGVAMGASALTYLISGSPFLAAGAAHNASYIAGILGGLGLMGYVVHKRFNEPDRVQQQKKEFISQTASLFKKNPRHPGVRKLVVFLLGLPLWIQDSLSERFSDAGALKLDALRDGSYR